MCERARKKERERERESESESERARARAKERERERKSESEKEEETKSVSKLSRTDLSFVKPEGDTKRATDIVKVPNLQRSWKHAVSSALFQCLLFPTGITRCC